MVPIVEVSRDYELAIKSVLRQTVEAIIRVKTKGLL